MAGSAVTYPERGGARAGTRPSPPVAAMLRRSHTFTTNLASLRRRNGSKARSYAATTAVLHRHRPPSQVRKPSLQGREGAAPPSAAAKTGPIPPRVPLESSAGADLRKLDSTERNGDSARVRVFGAFGFVWVRVCASALPRMHSLRPHVLRPSVRACNARTNVRACTQCTHVARKCTCTHARTCEGTHPAKCLAVHSGRTPPASPRPAERAPAAGCADGC